MTRTKKKKQRTKPQRMQQPVQQPVRMPGADRSQDAALLLSSNQLADLLNVSRSTLDRLVKSGAVPGRLMVGSQVRFHRPTIEAWLEQQIRGAN